MKGLVYLIQSNNLNYVGSTDRTIKKRLYDHQCWDLYDMNRYDYSVKILEEVEFNEKIELRQREQYYIDTIDCCNQLRAVGIPKNEMDKQYYERNKKRLIKKALEYQKTDKAKLTRKKRYENTKDKITEYNRNPVNKARRNQRVKELRERKLTWGGDPRFDNNLLQIDINIFNKSN